jgi:hypothetical protein
MKYSMKVGLEFGLKDLYMVHWPPQSTVITASDWTAALVIAVT